MRDWVQKKKWRQRPAGVSASVYHEHLDYSFLLCVAFFNRRTLVNNTQVLHEVSKCLFHLSIFFDC